MTRLKILLMPKEIEWEGSLILGQKIDKIIIKTVAEIVLFVCGAIKASEFPFIEFIA